MHRHYIKISHICSVIIPNPHINLIKVLNNKKDLCVFTISRHVIIYPHSLSIISGFYITKVISLFKTRAKLWHYFEHTAIPHDKTQFRAFHDCIKYVSSIRGGVMLNPHSLKGSHVWDCILWGLTPRLQEQSVHSRPGFVCWLHHLHPFLSWWVYEKCK